MRWAIKHTLTNSRYYSEELDAWVHKDGIFSEYTSKIAAQAKIDSIGLADAAPASLDEWGGLSNATRCRSVTIITISRRRYHST